MANKVVIALLIILGATSSLMSQPQYTSLYVESGYFIPSKESFRGNYDQALFIGTADIPLSFGIGIQYFVSRSSCLYLDLRIIKNLLASNEDISLTITPIVFGLYYYLPTKIINLGKFKPYSGIGVGFCRAEFNTKYLVTDESSPEPIGVAEGTQEYLGPNLKLTLGIGYQLGSTTSLGIALNYDINHTGTADEGGLGNVGGLLSTVKFTIGL